MKVLFVFLVMAPWVFKQECIDNRYYKAMQYLATSPKIKARFNIKKGNENFLKVSPQVVQLNLYFFKSELLGDSISPHVLSKNSDSEDVVVSRDRSIEKLSSNQNAKLIVFFPTFLRGFYWLKFSITQRNLWILTN